MRAPSAWMREKVPSGGVQPEVLASACAPGAPGASLWASPCTPCRGSCALGCGVPWDGTGSARDTRRAPTDLLAGLLPSPLGALLGVLPVCPTVSRVPQPPVETMERCLAPLCRGVIAPSHSLPGDGVSDVVSPCGSPPFSDLCSRPPVSVYAACAGFSAGRVSRSCLLCADGAWSDGQAQDVTTHVSLACLRGCEGGGAPWWCVLACSPQASPPCLDGLFAPLSAFPRLMEDDTVVGLSSAMDVVADLLAFACHLGWSAWLLPSVFQAVKRHGCQEG